jgi:hypothetical protein
LTLVKVIKGFLSSLEKNANSNFLLL